MRSQRFLDQKCCRQVAFVGVFGQIFSENVAHLRKFCPLRLTNGPLAALNDSMLHFVDDRVISKKFEE